MRQSGFHRHGETEDHALCGPIVMCCEKCKAPYGSFAPDQTNRVKTWLAQPASHLKGWFEGGLQTMYFVLCEPNDQNIFYFVEMGHAQALDLLLIYDPDSTIVPEIKQLRGTLEKAQNALSDYQQKKGLVASDERIDVRTAFDRYLPWEINKTRLIDGETFNESPYFGLRRSDTGRILGVGSDTYTVDNADPDGYADEHADGNADADTSSGSMYVLERRIESAGDE